MARWIGVAVIRGKALSPFRLVTRCRQCSGLAQKAASQPGTRRQSESPSLIHPERIAQPISIAPTRQDPYNLLVPQLSLIRSNLLGLLGSAHPGLSEIARYHFLQPSKQLRSLVVLLFSCATNGLGKNWDGKFWEADSEARTSRSEELDRPLKCSDVLNDPHPAMPIHTASFESVFELQLPGQQMSLSSPPPPQRPVIPYVISPSRVLSTQLRLAQIVEMIHIASVLHDEVHDPSADPSLGLAEPNSGFGNKLSILGGDFLLGRASTALARLGESEVVELIAGVISNLVEGEMLKVQGRVMHSLIPTSLDGPGTADEAWEIYLMKTYLKTASLFAKSARAAVILGGSRGKDIWKDVAYAYGRNLGIAYQLIQDALDYEANGESIEPGIATGPALFASEEHPELRIPIQRNLSCKGDVELAIQCVLKSSGIERTRLLAQTYTEKARDALCLVPDSEAKDALDAIVDGVIDRTW